MQYTTSMIKLVYEIRRSMPAGLKSRIKLTNPELFEELKTFYCSKSSNAAAKARVRELFNTAGQSLEADITAQSSSKSKMYRGVASPETTPFSGAQNGSAESKKVYRGQVIN